jgi:hypothetical protein
MNEPNHSPPDAFASQPTGVGQTPTAPTQTGAESSKVDPEIESQLRRRLGITTLILWGMHTAGLLLFLGNMLRGSVWLAVTLNVLLWVIEALYMLLLWGRGPLSLQTLRLLEGVLFGLLMAGYAGYICSPVRLGSLLTYAMGVDGSLSALAFATALPGFALLVTYGIFIPNTGVRRASIEGGMGLFPLLVTVAFGLTNPAVGNGPLVRFLAQLALWLALGAAIAIYGPQEPR